MTLIAANQEIYGLLRDGIPVKFDNAQGRAAAGARAACWISTRRATTAFWP